MIYKPGDRVWAHSDGTSIVRGWHQGVVTAEYGRGYMVELLEYRQEFKALARGLRPRHDENDTNLPGEWRGVPYFRPDMNWKRREAKT